MSNEIRYYAPDAAYGFLANVYVSPIVFDDKEWPTAEHAYQAMKFDDPLLKETIRNIPSGIEAKHFARDNEPGNLKSDWTEIRFQVMRSMNALKFLQNKELGQQLLETGDSPLIEDALDDPFWGSGPDDKGLNKAGEIVMEIRQLLSGNKIRELEVLADSQYGWSST